MVKKNSEKSINNDDFPPLSASPTRTKNPTPNGTGQPKDSAWIKVVSKKSKSVSPTANKKSTVKSPQYKPAVETKTAKSPKRPKPPSPTDHAMVSKRRHNPSVKIKQEFIDRVDTTKGLAPIFGTTNGKSPQKKGRREFDAITYDNIHSSPAKGKGSYGSGRGRSRGKRDKVQNRTSMRLRSINEGDRVTTTNKRAEYNNANTSPNLSVNQHTMLCDDSIEDSSDVVSSSSDDEDENYGIKPLQGDMNNRIDDQGAISDGNSIATANKSNVDRNKKVNKTDEGIKTVTPSKIQTTEQLQNTPRLGNMFGLMHMLSPTSTKARNKGNDVDTTVVHKLNDENMSSHNSDDNNNAKTIVFNDGTDEKMDDSELSTEVIELTTDDGNTRPGSVSNGDKEVNGIMDTSSTPTKETVKNNVADDTNKQKKKSKKSGKKTNKNSQGKKNVNPPIVTGGIQKNNPPKNTYKNNGKKAMQTRIDPEIKPIYARVHKIRYDVRLQLDSILEEPACMQAMVEKFKQLFIKIKEEESSAILYPYSSSSSAVPISDIKRLPNTYIEMKRYIPGFKPPLPNSDLVYGQIYVGTNTGFDDWKLTFLEWTKNHGHGLYVKFVQDERTTPAGYLLSTHKMSNSTWYQELISEKCKMPVSARFRKISGQKSKDRSAVHLECSRANHEQVKAFLRIHCSKTTKPPYLTGFPVIFIPDKMHISNNHAKAGAQIVAKRQGNIVNKIELRTSWSIFGIDMINKEHKISLRTMISRIMWEDDSGKSRQLFHSVDSTWNDEGTIFGWHPQFEDQAQSVMAGLLPYLKSKYGDSVESYFSQGAVAMQSRQRWDKDKGGLVGEDEIGITNESKSDSWWDDEEIADITGEPKVVIDATKVTTRDIPDEEDNASLPSLNTKVEGEDTVENNVETMQTLLNAPPPLRRTTTNDDTTISSSLTMDTRMDAIEASNHTMVNSVNFMNHMLKSFMEKQKEKDNNINGDNTNTTTSTTVVGAPSPGDQVK